MSRRRTRSFLWPTVAALVCLTITTTASIWQYRRGVEKDAVTAQRQRADSSAEILVPKEQVAEGALNYHQVQTRGEFLPNTLLLHDNQIRDRRVGYNVYSVLRISGSALHCLVKRGWVAASMDRSVMPEVATPSGEVEVRGLVLPGSTRFFELADNAAGNVWQNVTVERVAKAYGLYMQPFIIEQRNELADGLKRDWPVPVNASAKHYGYSFQWAAMATLIVILYGFFYVRRSTKQT